MKPAYTHVQTVPATTWSVTHNLNCVPVSDVIEADGSKVLPEAVKHIDNNTMQIVFTSPVAGKVRLVGKYGYERLSNSSIDFPLPWPAVAGAPALLYDTFSSPNGTQLMYHTPDAGGVWEMVSSNDPAATVIQNNLLRRPTETEAAIASGDPFEVSAAYGGIAFYNTTTLPSNEFSIEYKLTFTAEAFCEFVIGRTTYQTGVGYYLANSDKFMTLDFNDASSNTMSGLVDGYAENVFTSLGTYQMKHVFTGSVCNTYVNGTLVMTDTLGADWFANKLGFIMFDNSGNSNMRLDDVTVQTL